MNQDVMDIKAVRFCLWMGPMGSLIFAIGYVGFMGYFPPPHAYDTAQEITNYYLSNLSSIRVGTILMIFGPSLLVLWGVGVATLLRDAEGRMPTMYNLQMVSIAICGVLSLGFQMVWGLAAFRPDEIPPEIVRMLNDFGFFFFLFPVPPFAIWFLAIAASIFKDRRDMPAFPRWTGYFSAWTAVLSFPGMLMIFFKQGPFAFHGLIAFYPPLLIYFIWIVIMSWMGFRTLNRLEAKAVAIGRSVTY